MTREIATATDGPLEAVASGTDDAAGEVGEGFGCSGVCQPESAAGALSDPALPLGTAISVNANDHSVDGEERDPMSGQAAERVFAGGENFLDQKVGLSVVSDSSPSLEGAGAEVSKDQHYRACLAALKKARVLGARSDADARRNRNAFFGGVATLVAESGFSVVDFCRACGLPCTKATGKNPMLAVIQAGMGSVERKQASKLGTALSYAVGKCGGADKLQEFLDQHTIEECLQAARREKRTHRRQRTVPLKIIGAPAMANGLVLLTVDIRDGQAKFVSHAPAHHVDHRPTFPVAPSESRDREISAIENVPGATGGDSPSGCRPEAPEAHRDTAAGETLERQEVPVVA